MPKIVVDEQKRKLFFAGTTITKEALDLFNALSPEEGRPETLERIIRFYVETQPLLVKYPAPQPPINENALPFEYLPVNTPPFLINKNALLAWQKIKRPKWDDETYLTKDKKIVDLCKKLVHPEYMEKELRKQGYIVQVFGNSDTDSQVWYALPVSRCPRCEKNEKLFAEFKKLADNS